ncbi:MAG: hypothetical protein ABGX83_02695 [Nitrospira sp.]|nr:hypothetical protein [Candidatus Manganitrophaceae bacterium]HIL34874.1 hypothetical protein [Candidatus Manganitrophaceae bacterium]
MNISKTRLDIAQEPEPVFPDLYAPLFMLPPLPDRELPDRILVSIGKGYKAVRRIGFRGERIKPATASSVWNFEYAHEVEGVNRYFAIYEGQTYNLHLPNNIFTKTQVPTRLYLRIALPA